MCSPGINIVCLASTEFIFIIAVHIVLCFAFVAGMVLTAHSVLATAEQCLHGVKARPSFQALGVDKRYRAHLAETD